ncbi:response regulator [Actinoplanes teichomyceticus]|uniref:Response regulator receiver domain-containing protein n=1 Tax=Actinoplanes teichomyceticus TaxID=1867 RepID=A0A561VC74_ACTTI|nr:response regulator [Actinoplanes teichomyceticus]TWG09216.1 response regulator receiver domain-containing protein [Actinoplanes teichomyceticus]GIF17000.1 two-component system response regulator [Actinoplanes teichomyceticus]
MPTAPQRPLTILVVDDDDADVLMIEEALSTGDQPPTIERAADGQEALEHLRRSVAGQANRPDLILLDLNMPRMGGLETLAEIKNDEHLRMIPVVVLTTSDAAADVNSSYRSRASAFVTKPIDLESFETAVQKINTFYRDVARLP